MSAAQYRQAYGLKILNARHPGVRRLKRSGHQAEIHGNRFWNASYLAMDYLRRHPLPQGTRVLEVGCGWGLLGQFCAKRFGCQVHGTDADANVLPFLALQAQVNGVQMTAEQKSFRQLSAAALARYDLILGADICFWEPMTADLFSLIARAAQAGVRRVMIADPCRAPFSSLSRRCQQRYGAAAKDLDQWLTRPVKATGNLLLINL